MVRPCSEQKSLALSKRLLMACLAKMDQHRLCNAQEDSPLMEMFNLESTVLLYQTISNHF